MLCLSFPRNTVHLLTRVMPDCPAPLGAGQAYVFSLVLEQIALGMTVGLLVLLNP